MEHKLITGGGQWLPFARSRIKALQAGGTAYASQKFTMPDGALCVVWIEPGQEYIRLSGGGGEMKMDSGVVGITAFHELEPMEALDYRSEPLFETDSVRSYNATFSYVDTNGWRLNKSTTSSGQLSGDLSYKGKQYSGKVIQDGVSSRCVAAASIKNDATPPMWLEDQTDTSFSTWMKKVTMYICPASMYTGRCRLFVQAMYGQHMYSNNVHGDGSVVSDGKRNDEQYSLPSNMFGQPRLSLRVYTTTAYQQQDAKDMQEATDSGNETVRLAMLQTVTARNADIVLYVGSGVYFDSVTGNHWLLCPWGTGLTAYPLISSGTGEAWRKFLRQSSTELPDPDDRERLEAYILSACRPDTRKSQSVSWSLEVPTYSMGYGLHWNWDGITADIVYNTGYDQGFSAGFKRTGMESTHYRVTTSYSRVAKTDTTPESLVWSASASIIEGPVRWSVNRAACSIAEPNWVFLAEEKTLPQYSTDMSADAPFYVFYTRNVLKVCRCKTIITQPITGVRFESDGFTQYGIYGGSVDQFTLGANGGWMEDVNSQTLKIEYAITCGSATIRTQEGGNKDAIYHEISPGSMSAPRAPSWTQNAYPDSLYEPGVSLPVGNPTSRDSNIWSQQFFAHASADYVSSITVSETCTRKEYWDNHMGYLVAVVPLWDAEAIFLSERSIVTETVTSLEVRQQVTAGAIDGYYPVYRKMNEAIFLGFEFGGLVLRNKWWGIATNSGTLIISAPPPPADVVTLNEYLVCVAGDVPATMGDLTYYHDADDACTPNFACKAGCRTNLPTVISQTRIAPIGTDKEHTHTSLVGWV